MVRGEKAMKVIVKSLEIPLRQNSTNFVPNFQGISAVHTTGI